MDGIIEEVDEDGSGTVDFEGNLNYINELIFPMIKWLSILCRIYGDDGWIRPFNDVHVLLAFHYNLF